MDIDSQACRDLFCAIIYQAIHDACALGSDVAASQTTQARYFLLRNKSKLDWICMNAGIDEEALRDAMLKLAAKDWRAPEVMLSKTAIGKRKKADVAARAAHENSERSQIWLAELCAA